MKSFALFLLVLLYIGAGINHFWHPDPYYSIIPPYLGNPQLINVVAGIAEIVLGVLLIFPATRKYAAYGIILLLVAFIPSHVYMIQKNGCMGNRPALCIPGWLAWLRLFPLQFILMGWAWWCRE